MIYTMITAFVLPQVVKYYIILTYIYLFIHFFLSAIHVLTMTIHSKNVKMFKIHGCLANARAYRLHSVAADSTPDTWLQLIKTIKGLS